MKRAKTNPVKQKPGRKIKVLGVETNRLPGGKEYFWQLLEALSKDLRALPSTITEQLVTVLRTRDFNLFLDLLDQCALNKLKYSTFSLEEIRSMRVLSSLKKYQYPGAHDARLAKAIKKYLAAEQVCARVNRLAGQAPGRVRDYLSPIYDNARDFVKTTLGKFNMAEIFNEGRFGPGSSWLTEKSRTSALDKLQPPLSVTPECLPYVRAFLLTDERWLRSIIAWYVGNEKLITDCGSHKNPLSLYLALSEEERNELWGAALKIVPGNRIAFVPKNAGEERTITIEALLNLMLQLAVNSVMRKCLLARGIDLSTQSKNQQLAFLGSKLDDNVTIDLKSASDRISIHVVKDLLPPEWYRFLDNIRSHLGESKHLGTVHYEKFSSMGNGFTFALQTLLFASLIYGVVLYHGEEWEDVLPEIAVYGDDIIVPKRFLGDLLSALHYAGLDTNRDKTFCDGPIRESCGWDCYEGKRINVFSIDTPPSNIMEVCIRSNLYTSIFLEYFEEVPRHITALHRKWIPDESFVSGPLIMDHVAHWFFETGAQVIDLTRFTENWQVYRCIHGYSAKRIMPKIPRFLRVVFGPLTSDLRGHMSSLERFWSCNIEEHVVLPSSRFLGAGRDWPVRISRRTYKYVLTAES